MRRIELEDALTIRFVDKPLEFDQGVEIGMVAAMMASGVSRFERTVAADVVEPVRALADQLRYRVASQPLSDGKVRLAVTSSSVRPALRLVR